MATARKLLVPSTSAAELAAALPAQTQNVAHGTTAAPDSTTSVTPDQSAVLVDGAQERSGIDRAGDGEIVVTGIRTPIQATLNEKRRSDMVSEVITAQDTSKFSDKNVVDSLGRSTGVNVVTGSSAAGGFGENQSVSIRGTDPNLDLTLLDGHSVATGDWFVLDQTNGSRSFNFSMLPSEIVGRLEVCKSAQAAIIEGGIGGTVNVHTRLPLDLLTGTINLSAQGVHNGLAGDWQPQLSGVASWKNRDGTFGVLAALYQKRDFRRDEQAFLGHSSVANFNGTGQSVTCPTLIRNSYLRQQRVRKGGDVAIR